MLKNSFLRITDQLYSYLIRMGSNLQSFFVLYLRMTWGHLLFLIGLGKLQAIVKTADFFASLNIPFPIFHAYAVGLIEAVCGFLLFTGLMSRLAAIPIIVVMLTALSTAHAADLSNFHFLFEPQKLVAQAPYPFLITALVVFIFGPGRVSVDAWLKRWISKQPRY